MTKARGPIRGGLASALSLAALALLAFAAPASADQQICGAGSGAGQCTNPNGIAYDSVAERLYVADRGNARVDVFTPAGVFLKAFGWGVADGSAELQSCVATCLKGTSGFGAGEFGSGPFGEPVSPEKIAVDPASHDVYVMESFRVQRFSSEGEFLGAWGGGVITGGAAGTGDLAAGSKTVSNVKTTKKAFIAGQEINGAGIPAETKIVALGPGTITLSKQASASGTGVALSVSEGVGNKKVNEVQELIFGAPGNEYWLIFEGPDGCRGETPRVSAGASTAASIKAALESLSCIDPGDVEVTGPVKVEGHDTYKIEFRGRFEDTDVKPLRGPSFFTPGVGKRTLVNGASAFEQCTPANAADCTTGVEGEGKGQFGFAARPIAVGPGGIVYVGDSGAVEQEAALLDNRVQEFEPSGAFVKEIELDQKSNSRISALVITPSGNFYVAPVGGVRKYDAGGSLLGTAHTSNGNINALALDAAGDLFVGDSSDAGAGGETAIYEYDPAGAPLRTFYGNGTLLSRPVALAPFEGDLLAAEGGPAGRVVQIAFPPPGPVVHHEAKLNKAEPIANTRATLRARVNPEGKATEFRFQYVDDAKFKASEFAEAKETPVTSLPGPVDFALHDAIAGIGCPDPESEAGKPGSKCLVPETTYHFRAVAENADGGPHFGPERQFTTLAPFQIVSTWSTDVGVDSARLHASVNPLTIPAKGLFLYVDRAAYEKDIEEGGDGFSEAIESSPLDFGAGNAPKAAAAQLGSLAPGTTYRYRLLVSDFFTGEAGPEGSFTTFLPTLPAKTDCPNQIFREGPSASLPDCRAYELVSPLDKDNGDVIALAGAQGFSHIDQARPDGQKLTYSAYRAFADPQSAPFSSQYIAQRDPSAGWTSRPINAPREGPSLYSAANGAEVPFKGFSEDLCSGWYLQDTENPLAEGAPEGIPNLYRRRNCGAEGYELITTAKPPGYGKEIEGHDSQYRPTLQGFSADNLTSVFRSGAPLTEGASKEDIYQTYLLHEGQLHLISVLQGAAKAAAADTNSSVGTGSGQLAAASNFRIDSVHHAISADASKVFFSAEINLGTKAHDPSAGPMGPSRLYLRINPTEPQSAVKSKKCTEAGKGCTVPISELASPEAATFWSADPQGARALFTVAGNLYEVDTAKAIAYEAGAVSLVASKVKGLLGASEDATRVYLVSEEDLDAAGPAVAGKANLYLHEAGGGFAFVAKLAEDNAHVNEDAHLYAPDPYARGARVSADGLHLAFMSRGSPTGYDNSDAAGPASCEPSEGGACNLDAEVYLYDAEGGALRCISCNPSGARPVGGRLFHPATSEGGSSAGGWVIARIPGWETQYYPSRVLSADGSRLYFESFEALVPRDTNGKQDVYQWERAGSAKACRETGAELFSPSAGGCISLISSGTGAGDAEFLDASADGSDVFFITGTSLLAQDYGLLDVYDARQGGGFPAPPEGKAPCEGEACQSPPSPPQVPTPASSTFQGQGNLQTGSKPGRRPCPKGKRRVRAAGKARCVKPHKSQTQSKRRGQR